LKNKETLHIVKSRNLFSFLLAWLAMDIKEANDANMVDPNDDEDINIDL